MPALLLLFTGACSTHERLRTESRSCLPASSAGFLSYRRKEARPTPSICVTVPVTCCSHGTWDFALPGARSTTLKKPLCNIACGRTSKKHSSLGSSQGVASPPLPNVCGWDSVGCECTGTEGTVSDVRQQRRRPHHERRQGERAKRPPLPSPLGPEGDQGRFHSPARARRRTRGERVTSPECPARRKRENQHGHRKPLTMELRKTRRAEVTIEENPQVQGNEIP